MIAFVALGNMTQSRWWLLPLGAVHALLTLECVALYERRRGIPELLASRSLQDPFEGPFVMPEHEVARSLVVLAGNDQRVIQRALRLLQHGEPLEHPQAHRRLVHADCLAAEEQNADRRGSGCRMPPDARRSPGRDHPFPFVVPWTVSAVQWVARQLPLISPTVP